MNQMKQTGLLTSASSFAFSASSSLSLLSLSSSSSAISSSAAVTTSVLPVPPLPDTTTTGLEAIFLTASVCLASFLTFSNRFLSMSISASHGAPLCSEATALVTSSSARQKRAGWKRSIPDGEASNFRTSRSTR